MTNLKEYYDTELELPIIKKMHKLAEKREQIKARFGEAKEKANKDLIVQQNIVTEAKLHLQELYTMSCMGDISSSSYESEKDKVAVLQSKLTTAEQRVQDIDGLLKREIENEIVRPIETLGNKVSAEFAQLEAEKVAKLRKLRQEYLTAITIELSLLSNASNRTTGLMDIAYYESGLRTSTYYMGLGTDRFTRDLYPHHNLTVGENTIRSLMAY